MEAEAVTSTMFSKCFCNEIILCVVDESMKWTVSFLESLYVVVDEVLGRTSEMLIVKKRRRGHGMDRSRRRRKAY